MVFYYSLHPDANSEKHAPVRKHPQDAGADLPAWLTEPLVLRARSSALVPTAIKTHFPDGYVGMIKSRSGLGVKYGLEVGCGVVDSNFENFIGVKLYNHSDTDFIIEDGMRIAQILIIPIYAGPIVPLPTSDQPVRGENGFGSTGH